MRKVRPALLTLPLLSPRPYIFSPFSRCLLYTSGPDFVIFNGPDEQLLAGRLMGATAGIGGTYGTMTELYLELTRLIETGDIETAKKMQTKINDCIYELLSFGSLYGCLLYTSRCV